MLICLSIAFFDIKLRHIYLWQLLSLGAACIVLGMKTNTISWLITINIAFISLTYLAVIAYSKIRGYENSSKMIGSGDWYFLLAISPLFHPYDFIVFFTFGILISLVIGILLQVLFKTRTTPLAGLLGLWLVLTQMNKWI